MSAVAQAISEVVDPLAEVVGQVEDTVVKAAEQVGKAVESVGQTIGKTAEAIAENPEKGLALIAVAVVAPELAPLLWEGATAAEAAMVLNAGISVASGKPIDQVAANLAIGAVTQGLTAEIPVDVSTGSNMLDRALVQGAVRSATGGDFAQGVGSSIGGSLIGMGTGATANAVSGAGSDIYNAFNQDTLSPEAPTPAPVQAEAPTNQDQQTVDSKAFQDAIDAGFSKEEAYAIAKGQEDANAPLPSYQPTASNASVTVEPASDVQEPTTPLVQAKVYKEDLDRELADGEIDQQTYDALVPYATEQSKSEATYVDPYEVDGAQTSPIDATAAPSPVEDGLTGTKTGEDGNTTYTYDDGSTLTVSGNGEVVDFTEATDEGVPTEEEQAPSEEGGTRAGFGIKIPLGSMAKAASQSYRKTGTKTSAAPTTTGGLDTISSTQQYGSPLTAGISTGNPEYSILGETEKDQPQMFAAGGAAAQDAGSIQGVTDLSYTANSPFSADTKIMALKPNTIKGKIDYALPGYPFGKEWRLAKNGGHMVEDDHNPEFFSEGGLGSLKNRYVKGAGDGTSDSIKAMLADGEFVIPADVVSSLGNGSNDSGAKVLDEFLRTIRAHKRKADPKKLPPDSKGALGYLLEAKKRVKK